MKKTIALFFSIFLLINTSVAFADYVDTSNRNHADGQNDIIEKAYVSNGHTVIVYIKNEKGIEDKLAFLKNNFSIPFVDVLSVNAEKKKYNKTKGQEVDSEYYNKITLEVTKDIHDKQRFIVLKEYRDGDGENAATDLMFSIAPLGEQVSPVNKTTKSTSNANVIMESDTLPGYNDFFYAAQRDASVYLVFKDYVKFDPSFAKNLDNFSATGIKTTPVIVGSRLVEPNIIEIEFAEDSGHDYVKLKLNWMNYTIRLKLPNGSSGDLYDPDKIMCYKVERISPTEVHLIFSGEITADSANNLDNYNFSETFVIEPTTIYSAKLLEDNKTVKLTVKKSEYNFTSLDITNIQTIDGDYIPKHRVSCDGDFLSPDVMKTGSSYKPVVTKATKPTYKHIYNQITSAVAKTNTKVVINFKNSIDLDMSLIKDTGAYHLSGEDGTVLYVKRAYMTNSKQVILETEKQVKNQRFDLKIDWLDTMDSGVDFLYSNSNSENEKTSSTPSQVKSDSPKLKKITTTDSTTLILFFEKDFNGDTSLLEDPNNYVLDSSRGALDVMSASMKSKDRIVLKTSQQTPGVKYKVECDWIDSDDSKANFRGSRIDHNNETNNSDSVKLERVKCTSANTVDITFDSPAPEDQALNLENYKIYNAEDESEQYDILSADLSSDGKMVTLTVGPFTKFIRGKIDIYNFVRAKHGQSSFSSSSFYVYSNYFE